MVRLHHVLKSKRSHVSVPRLRTSSWFPPYPKCQDILDNTGVHPESYPAVKDLFKQLDITDLDDSAKEKLKALNLKETAEELGLGQETLKDIIADLLKPGRDLRDDFEAPVLRQDVLELKDLSVGQNLKGQSEMLWTLVPLWISVSMRMALSISLR